MTNATSTAHKPTMLSRRRFLQAALAAGSVTAISPKLFFGDSALAGPPLGPTDHIVVLVELSGGNDGLNTLVPYTNPTYYGVRGPIAIPANAVLPLDGSLGLHPELLYLKSRFDQGNLAVIPGTGQIDLDHSHFSCMAKMQAGVLDGGSVLTGWAGRWLDGTGLDGFGGISVANGGVPLLLQGQSFDPTGLPSWSGGLFGSDRTNRYDNIAFDALSAIGGSSTGLGTWPDEIGKTTRYALGAAQQVNPIYSPSVDDNSQPLVRDLTLCARLINLDLGARVLHVSLGSFDTHDDQLGWHGTLLGRLDRGIEAFFNALAPQFQSRVVLATFTEFGRRVEANSSNGTDHGTSSPMFVVGSRVRGGLHGAQPSLTALDARDDLQVTTDIRSVFATILSRWLGADDQQVLGVNLPKLELFQQAASCAVATTDNIASNDAFVPMSPARLLDTRSGLGAAGPVQLGPGQQLDLQVGGRATIPANAAAVILNVTATNPDSVSYLTVWPAGSGRPNASNLNVTPGQTAPNLVIAKLGDNGRVSIFNERGSVDVIADVCGWFPATNGYQPLVPSRVLDTRLGIGGRNGMLGQGETIGLHVAGAGGVPSSGATAVVMNVTAAEPSAVSFVTVWPAGEQRPNASNLNLVPNRTVPNLVIAKLGGDGSVQLYNDNGSTHLIADVCGWFPASSGFHPLTPARVLDTRNAIGASGRLGEGRTVDIGVLCGGGVPKNARAVVMNVTVTEPDRGGYMTVWPAGDPNGRPDASNLNYGPGQTVPNLVVAQIGVDGMVSMFNAYGSTHAIADVMGWFE